MAVGVGLGMGVGVGLMMGVREGVDVCRGAVPLSDVLQPNSTAAAIMSAAAGDQFRLSTEGVTDWILAANARSARCIRAGAYTEGSACLGSDESCGVPGGPCGCAAVGASPSEKVPDGELDKPP